MSCSVFVHIKYDKKLEEDIKKIKGVISNGKYGDFQSVVVPEDLFPQHKKEADVHKWVTRKDGTLLHFPENPGNWEYKGHGFNIWLEFKNDNGEKEIVFVVACHWNYDHGHYTILDIEQWIKDNLGNVGIIKGDVSP